MLQNIGSQNEALTYPKFQFSPEAVVVFINKTSIIQHYV